MKLVQSAELARFGSMLVVFVGALIVLVMVDQHAVARRSG